MKNPIMRTVVGIGAVALLTVNCLERGISQRIKAEGIYLNLAKTAVSNEQGRFNFRRVELGESKIRIEMENNQESRLIRIVYLDSQGTPERIYADGRTGKMNGELGEDEFMIYIKSRD